MPALRLGTRGSPLARWQAEFVRARLCQHWPALEVELVTIREAADQRPEAPLDTFEGEGVFVKALEAALSAQHIDAAVHSLKDLPLQLPSALRLEAVLAREDPRDALVAARGLRFADLPAGARVGTSSLRRRSQLLRLRPDLRLMDMRGNVDTRLRKLDRGDYDAIVLAACGLIRLGLQDRITETFSVQQVLPEPGQGALAVEARAADAATRRVLAVLEEPATRACVEAERAFLAALGGGCRVPIAAFARLADGQLHLEGAVVRADGRQQVRQECRGPMAAAAALGTQLGRQLMAEGALELLKTPV